MKLTLFLILVALAASCGPQHDETTAALKDLAPAPPRPGEGGYAPALDERIDLLLKDMEANGPSTMNNVKTRALTLYDWANAAALDGTRIHPDLPSLVAIITQPNFEQMNPIIADTLIRLVDNFIRELAIRRHDPDAFGTLTMEILDPGEAVGHLSLVMTHTLGAQSILPGGGYLAPNHFRFSFMEYQTDDPQAPNYVTITSSNPSVKFEPSNFPVQGQYSAALHGGGAPRLFFRLAEGALMKGDTVSITFGDRSQGSPGMETVHFANTALRYAVWTITAPLDEGGLLHALPEPPVPLAGREAVSVRGFIEPMAGTDETATLTIRAEDSFRNLANDGVPEEWILRLNGEVFGKVPTNDESLIDVALSFKTPGVKRFTIESSDGIFKGEADPILIEDAPAERIFFGDTHGHSGWAEGLGLVDPYFAFAREQSRLQFVVLSEHDLWMDLGEWAQMREAVERHRRPGHFETFMGYEWTVDARFGGHHNVLFRTPDTARLASRQIYPNLERLYAALSAFVDEEDVLVIPHAHMPGDWTTSDKDLERLVEIASYHGTFEWFGRNYLDEGWRVGFIGSSDDHTGSPGYRPRAYGAPGSDGFGGIAAVSAPTLERDAIFDAMRARRTYATNGARIILQATLDGEPMGSVLPETAARRLSGRVVGTDAIDAITLVKNGDDLETLNYSGNPGGEIIEIAFLYDSEPPTRRASPSDTTIKGRLVLKGARAASVAAPVAGALNSLTEGADLSDGGRAADFRLRSGGRTNVLELSLEGMPKPGAALRLDLANSQLPYGATAPGEPIEIALDEFRERAVKMELGGGVCLRVRRVSPATLREAAFTFSDETDASVGDYYFVRVRQRNGGMAWTSPWWIGEPKRRSGR